MQQPSPFAIAFRLKKDGRPEVATMGLHLERLAQDVAQYNHPTTRRELEAELKRARALLSA